VPLLEVDMEVYCGECQGVVATHRARTLPQLYYLVKDAKAIVKSGRRIDVFTEKAESTPCFCMNPET